MLTLQRPAVKQLVSDGGTMSPMSLRPIMPSNRRVDYGGLWMPEKDLGMLLEKVYRRLLWLHDPGRAAPRSFSSDSLACLSCGCGCIVGVKRDLGKFFLRTKHRGLLWLYDPEQE